MNTSAAVKDAAAGGALGSLAGPWGTAIGAGLGGLYGLFSPDQQASADQAKLDEMKKIQAAYGAYRPQNEQTRMREMQNRLAAYQGANNVLASMYGPQGSMAPAGARVDPMSGQAMESPPPPLQHPGGIQLVGKYGGPGKVGGFVGPGGIAPLMRGGGR